MWKFIFTVLAAASFSGCAVPQSWDIPDSPRFRTAEAKYLAGDFAGAADAFAELAEIPGSDSRAISRYWEGRARLEIGDFAAAESAFLDTLEENPPKFFLGGALLGLGWAYIGMQRFEEAVPPLVRAVADAPDVIQKDFAHLLLGTAYLRSSDWDKGMNNLDAAVKEGKDSESARQAASSLAFRKIRAFTIQTGAYSTRSVAENGAKRLTEKGLDAWVHPLGGAGQKELMFAVCVGRFENWRTASNETARLRGRGYVHEAVVKP
jgi:tetratricopeptide (TPR) repeat protein